MCALTFQINSLSALGSQQKSVESSGSGLL